MKKIILSTLTLTLWVAGVYAQKLDVKDIAAKHLASIVSPQQKTKVTNLTGVGETTWSQGANHQREYTGKSVLVSDGNKIAFAAAFPIQDYPFERVTYDGRKLSLPFTTPGRRSPLGNYLFANDEIVKDGLFGGVLSMGWIFYTPDEKRGSISSSGTKKIDGKDAYVVSYNTKGGTGLIVKLYFDVATGRHVRTEYRRSMSGSMVSGVPEASAGATREIIEEMSEDYGDFKTEAGVTLPRSYKIRIAQIDGGNSREWTYLTKIATFYYNQQLDADTFDAVGN
jgi:hypothetical protein